MPPTLGPKKPRGTTPHTDSKVSFHQHGREGGGLGASLLADSRGSRAILVNGTYEHYLETRDLKTARASAWALSSGRRRSSASLALLTCRLSFAHLTASLGGGVC